MHIGHVNLAESFNGAGEHFVQLIEGIQRHSVEQTVLVRNVSLARRLKLIEGVTVGPIVRSPVSAYCLMPATDLVHIHDTHGAATGLLLALTRGTPFVMTCHDLRRKFSNPVSRAAGKRAAVLIDEATVSVTEHLQVYRAVTDKLHVPTMLL